MVGLNGEGKTTLIKLMCGLYRPTEGDILLNGVSVNDYDRDEYFRLFSTVFQDMDVLPVTIAENISGKTAEETDFPKLYDCMKKSVIYDKVMSLPQKENTHLVKTVYDDATDFSGGQMQKLALAKALYKSAPVLLLDEPTAALDPIAEQEMYLNFKREVKRVHFSQACFHAVLRQDNPYLGRYDSRGGHAPTAYESWRNVRRAFQYAEQLL